MKKSITASLSSEIEKQMLAKVKKDGKRLSLVKVGEKKEQEQKENTKNRVKSILKKKKK